MIGTKFINENYRKSVLEDKVAIAILAHLYLNLPQDENEITKVFPQANIKLKLAELFRSSLIKRVADKIWGISGLGKSIILKSNLSSTILDYQLDQLNITDKYFLLGCIKSQEESESNYTNIVTSYIKTLKWSIQEEKADYKVKDKLFRDIVYAFIVGMDSNIRALGYKEYSEYIINKIYGFEGDFVKQFSLLKSQKKLLIQNCKEAETNFKMSNMCFLESGAIHNASEVVKKLTSIRILNPLINNEVDYDIQLFLNYPNLKETTMDFSFLQTEVESFGNLFFDFNTDKKNIINKIKSESQKKFTPPEYTEVRASSKVYDFSFYSFLMKDKYLESLTKEEISEILNDIETLRDKVKSFIEKKYNNLSE